jgi:hypothetical protein
MTGSGENRRRAAERVAWVGLAVRLGMIIWEIVREHVLHGTGPGRLL